MSWCGQFRTCQGAPSCCHCVESRQTGLHGNQRLPFSTFEDSKTPKPELISVSCRLCATLKSIPALCGSHVRTHRKLPKPTHQGYSWVTGQISEFVGIAQVGVQCQVRHTIPKLEFEFSVSASWRYWNRFERGRINYDWSRTKVHSSARTTVNSNPQPPAFFVDSNPRAGAVPRKIVAAAGRVVHSFTCTG